MKYETSLVYLEQLPKVAIDTGFDWPTFFSFMATIAVFAIGTWMTVRSSNKNYYQQDQILRQTLSSQEKALFLTINAQEKSLRITNESQEKIARANAVKVSRQAWIDQLRDACSSYLSLILIMNGHINEKDAKVEFGKALINSSQAGMGAELVMSWIQSRNDLRLKIFELKYKIDLLANPKEKLFQQLLALIHEGAGSCETAKSEEILKLCERIKSLVQEILKVEWDRTKNMM